MNLKKRLDWMKQRDLVTLIVSLVMGNSAIAATGSAQDSLNLTIQEFLIINADPAPVAITAQIDSPGLSGQANSYFIYETNTTGTVSVKVSFATASGSNWTEHDKLVLSGSGITTATLYDFSNGPQSDITIISGGSNGYHQINTLFTYTSSVMARSPTTLTGTVTFTATANN